MTHVLIIMNIFENKNSIIYVTNKMNIAYEVDKGVKQHSFSFRFFIEIYLYQILLQKYEDKYTKMSILLA